MYEMRRPWGWKWLLDRKRKPKPHTHTYIHIHIHIDIHRSLFFFSHIVMVLKNRIHLHFVKIGTI